MNEYSVHVYVDNWSERGFLTIMLDVPNMEAVHETIAQITSNRQVPPILHLDIVRESDDQVVWRWTREHGMVEVVE